MKLTALRRRLALLLTNIESQSQQSSYFHEFHVSKQWGLWTDRTINPLTRNPQRFWSQADEDGIISKIFERMSISGGTFMEFGCGDGLQNNSLALIAKGWRGGWVDGSPLPYQISEAQHVVNFQNSWVTKENVSELFENGLRDFVKNTNHVSMLSMDLDGNDYHFLESLFSSGKSADLVVLEYNARFPVGSKWTMPYNENHAWKGDDYFGASLSSFSDLLSRHGYKLVACSVQGSNAFYVHNSHIEFFADINLSEEEIYQPPLYYLIHQWAQKASGETVLSMMRQLSL